MFLFYTQCCFCRTNHDSMHVDRLTGIEFYSFISLLRADTTITIVQIVHDSFILRSCIIKGMRFNFPAPWIITHTCNSTNHIHIFFYLKFVPCNIRIENNISFDSVWSVCLSVIFKCSWWPRYASIAFNKTRSQPTVRKNQVERLVKMNFKLICSRP